jgi:hypothetical protein
MSESELWREIKALRRKLEELQTKERPLPTDFAGGIDLTRSSSFTLTTTSTRVISTTNFRGLVLVSETAVYGGFAVFALDGGNSIEVVDTINMYSPTLNNANTVNVYITGGVPTIQNNRPATVTLMVQPIRSS